MSAGRSVVRLFIAVAFNAIAFGGLLFLPAGALGWWRAWVLLAVVSAASLASTILIERLNPSVIDERMKAPLQRDQPLADKLVVMPLLAGFFAVIGFVPVDRFHLHVMAPPGPVVSALGLVAFLAGWALITAVLCVNPFAAPVVKHQPERGQRVIDRGPYAIVRHPMYTGTLGLLVGLPLWLESYGAALLAVVPIALLVVRIVFEERFLVRTLEGYEEYRRRVRSRLVPGVW